MSVRFKLCLMMFLEFLIWGAWYPLIFNYLPSLGFTKNECLLCVATFNVSALVAMFFSTQFADRNFAAEKFLAFSHLVGGAAILALYWVKRPELAPGMTPDQQPPANFLLFFALMLVHTLLYVPTISITNSIAFANLQNPHKEFGPIRLWGTIGWIAASIPFIFVLADWDQVAEKSVGKNFIEWLGIAISTAKQGAAFREATSFSFITAGVASLVLAAFSLTLPHTPPKPVTAGSGDKLAWLEAMKLLRLPFVLVLFIVTFLDATVHQMYFFWTFGYLTSAVEGIPGNWAPQVMTIGQFAEIVTMAFLGYVLKRLGWRYTMVIGILGHAVRFSVFAYFPTAVPVILVITLHGICYAFFFATVYIFVDEFFPKDARSSAQGLFNFLILGAGPLVGNFLCGELGEYFVTPDKTVNFREVFLVPAGIAVVAAIILLVFFRPPEKKEVGMEHAPALTH
jgi:nucleoside transporter